MRWLLRYLCLLVGMCSLIVGAARADQRLTVFISDLHMGLGRGADGKWHPYEDFRWSGALAGFLDAIGCEGKDRVDLVILGDLLEYWQLPEDIRCAGAGPNTGCSEPELVAMTTRILSAHEATFVALRAFAKRGDNRLYLVPGNHDAALLIPDVWKLVVRALAGEGGRVSFVASGLWRSEDGRIFAEHGHQIGSDVNRFDAWPTVTAPSVDGQSLMIRPWGELFVQRLFNAEERQYPIIDNLSPESAGARYRIADRGLWGSAADMARFIAFNIFQTSVDQKAALLSLPPTPGAVPTPPLPFDRRAALRAGHTLFTASLPPDDPMQQLLDGPDALAAELRRQLAALADSLSDEELQMLCKNALLYTKADPCRPQLSAAIAARLVPREALFGKHLAERRRQAGQFEVFIFGHTHKWEAGWPVSVPGGRPVTVFNSGAFQRVVDEAGFLDRARARGWSPSEALRRLQPEDLAPCYAAVVVKPDTSGTLEAALRLWQQDEGGAGRFRQPGVFDCK